MKLPSPITLVIGGVGLLVVCLLLLWANPFDIFGRVKHAKAVAAAATTQSKVDTESVKSVDHYTEKVTIIHEKALNDVQKVRVAPTADTKLDPAFRATLCAAELCDQPAKRPDDHGAKRVP